MALFAGCKILALQIENQNLTNCYLDINYYSSRLKYFLSPGWEILGHVDLVLGISEPHKQFLYPRCMVAHQLYPVVLESPPACELGFQLLRDFLAIRGDAVDYGYRLVEFPFLDENFYLLLFLLDCPAHAKRRFRQPADGTDFFNNFYFLLSPAFAVFIFNLLSFWSVKILAIVFFCSRIFSVFFVGLPILKFPCSFISSSLRSESFFRMSSGFISRTCLDLRIANFFSLLFYSFLHYKFFRRLFHDPHLHAYFPGLQHRLGVSLVDQLLRIVSRE